MCRFLAQSPHDVTLIAPDAPAGDALVEGVRTIGFRRPANRWGRISVLPRILLIALRTKADVYHFHDPELLLVGFVLRLMGRRTIYDIHEDYAAALKDRRWINPLVARIIAPVWGVWEWSLARFMTARVAATPAIARKFPSRNTTVVQNFPVVDELMPPFSAVQERSRIMFHGVISEARGAREMVAAIHLLRDLGLRLTLAGPIDATLLERLQKLPGWDRVDYRPWLDREEIAGVAQAAIAGLVVFHPLANHVESQPNKIFEYMSAGLPLVASNFPLWRNFVEENQCGIMVDPLDPSAIAAAVRRLHADPAFASQAAENGRRVAKERYSWESQFGKLLTLYERILS